MSKKKLWKESRAEIEQILNNDSNVLENELSISNGIHHKHTISHFSSVITSIAYQHSYERYVEFYVANCTTFDGSKSFLVQWKYDCLHGTYKVKKKALIGQCLKFITWIPGQNAFVGYSEDMTLRGFTGTFQEKSKLNVNASILCMMYVEDFDEFITAGQGFVFSWNMKLIDYGFLVEPKEPPLQCDITSTREWVLQLFYDKFSKSIVALTDESIYLISLIYRRQVQFFPNTHRYSLTYCTFYRPFLYFITAARDGSVHIYHTGMQTLIRTFSAHIDGLTGVVTLSQKPILISWSHKSGNIRMWRLDTFELSSEITLSQTIQGLFLPHDDRLFYFSQKEVEIFSVNVVYSIFCTLTSPIEVIKLGSIRRKIKYHSAHSCSSKECIVDLSSEKKLPSCKKSNHLHNRASKIHALSSKASVISIKNNQNVELEKTFLDERLICILRDNCIVSVSPATGAVLGNIFPPVDVDTTYLSFNVHHTGNFYYATLSNGKCLEFDCSVNPGNLNTVIERGKKDEKIISVCAMEICVDEGSKKGTTFQATFFGLDNGIIMLYNKKKENKKNKVTLKGTKKKSPSQLFEKKSLTMNPFKAHQGNVSIMQELIEGSVIICDERIPEINLQNIILTYGEDYKLVVWKVSVFSGSSHHSMEVSFHKMQSLKLNFSLTCVAVTNNVLLCGFDNGKVEMYNFKWKYFVSDIGAKITIECNSVILSSFKKIDIEKELYHKSSVISVHASILLGLFVTVGKDSLVKVWECDGLLIRELHLGDVIQTACFAYGYNLLVGLHNHIVLVEAKTYLPVEYLQKLLELDDFKKVVDAIPENAVALKDNNTSETSKLMQNKHEEKNIDTFGVSAVDLSVPYHHQVKRINPLMKYLRSRKTFLTQASDATISEEDEITAVFSGIKMKEFTPIVKVVDKAKNIVSEIQQEHMKNYIVAPDGEIPNSIVRLKVKPIFAQYMHRESSVHAKSNQAQLFQIKKKKIANFHQLRHDGLTPVQSSESIQDQSSIKGLSLSKKQVLELSDRLKWEIKEEYEEMKVESKFGSKRKSKMRNAVVLKVKKPQESKQLVKSEAEAKKETNSRTLEKLLELLRIINQQRWCSHIITYETFDEGFSAIADILNRAGNRIAFEICQLLNDVLDACNALKTEENYSHLFNEKLQKKYLHRLGELLFSSVEPLQAIAAEILSKFNDEMLLISILNDVMPKFFVTSPTTMQKTVNPNPTVVSQAAAAVKNFSKTIDTGRLYQLTRLVNVDSYRCDFKDESNCVEEIAQALAGEKIDPIDLQIWANFGIPLLSNKELPPRFTLSRDMRLSSAQLVKLQVKPNSLRATRNQLQLQALAEDSSNAQKDPDAAQELNEKIERRLSRGRLKKQKRCDSFKFIKPKHEATDAARQEDDAEATNRRKRSLPPSNYITVPWENLNWSNFKKSLHDLSITVQFERRAEPYHLDIERQTFDDQRVYEYKDVSLDSSMIVEKIALKHHESDDDQFVASNATEEPAQPAQQTVTPEQRSQTRQSISIIKARRKSFSKPDVLQHFRSRASAISKKSDTVSLSNSNYFIDQPRSKRSDSTQLKGTEVHGEGESFLPVAAESGSKKLGLDNHSSIALENEADRFDIFDETNKSAAVVRDANKSNTSVLFQGNELLDQTVSSKSIILQPPFNVTKTSKTGIAGQGPRSKLAPFEVSSAFSTRTSTSMRVVGDYLDGSASSKTVLAASTSKERVKFVDEIPTTKTRAVFHKASEKFVDEPLKKQEKTAIPLSVTIDLSDMVNATQKSSDKQQKTFEMSEIQTKPIKGPFAEKRFITEISSVPNSASVVIEGKRPKSPLAKLRKPTVTTFALDDRKSSGGISDAKSLHLEMIKVTKSISFENDMLSSYNHSSDVLSLPRVSKSLSCHQLERQNISVMSVFKKRFKSSKRLKKTIDCFIDQRETPVDHTASIAREALLPRRLCAFLLQHGGDNVPDQVLHPRSWRDVLRSLRFVRLRADEILSETVRLKKEKPVSPAIALPRPLTGKATGRSQYYKIRHESSSQPYFTNILKDKSNRDVPNAQTEMRKMDLGVRSSFGFFKDPSYANNSLVSSQLDSYYKFKLDPRSYFIPHKVLKDDMALLHKRLGQYFNVIPSRGEKAYSPKEYLSFETCLPGIEPKTKAYSDKNDLVCSLNKQKDPLVKVRYKWKHSYISSLDQLPSL